MHCFLSIPTQRSHSWWRLTHPCAFFSKKLTSEEINYDFRNRELLAIKMALEEWHLWLEGAHHPFIVYIDHKNLEYLREAKRWALFFTRFNFTISNRPGSRIIKADALSRQFSPNDPHKSPDPIVPLSLIVSPIQWSLEEQLAKTNTNTLPECPPNRTYIPRAHRTPLILSVHSSMRTGHPGTSQTLSLLKDCFWWPGMI